MNSTLLKSVINSRLLFLLCLAVTCTNYQALAVSFAGYVTYPTGSWPEAVAIADLNGDGRKDVVLSTSTYSNTNDNSILVFYQNKGGGLDAPVRYAAGANAVSVVIADFNGDGLKDI